MAARLSFASAPALMFGYRQRPAVRDPIALRPAIPAPPAFAEDPADVETPPASGRVRTPVGVASGARAAIVAVALGALYGGMLALTSGLIDGASGKF